MNLTTLTNTVTASARTLDKLAGGVEALALAVVTRAAGWVACIPTIALTARSCEMIFELAPQTAVASAVALELVGQSATANWLRAKEWNKAKGAKSPPASEWLALAMVVGYFATDFILIAALQAPKALVEPVYWTALLFPLAQVISTLTMGQRALQFRREADAEVEGEKRSRAAKEGAVTRALRKAESANKHGGNGRAQSITVNNNGKRSFADFEHAMIGGDLDITTMTGYQIGEWAGKSAATGRRWKRLAGNGQVAAQ